MTWFAGVPGVGGSPGVSLGVGGGSTQPRPVGAGAEAEPWPAMHIISSMLNN